VLDLQLEGGVFSGLNSNMVWGPSHRARIPATTDIHITNASPIGSAIDFEYGVYLFLNNITSLQVKDFIEDLQFKQICVQALSSAGMLTVKTDTC
jgi:hypothetical protein